MLKLKFNLKPIIQKTIHTFNITESALAELIENIEIPSGINLAYLPQTGRVDLRIYGIDEFLISKTFARIEPLLKKYIFGFDDDNISKQFHSVMSERDLTISLAESCTGGLIQKMITENSGSSKYLLGGIVSYSNEIKNKILKVSNQTLEKYGAVSAEVAEEMLLGVQKLFSTDIAISITGIAGPTGGTTEKPVDNCNFFKREY